MSVVLEGRTIDLGKPWGGGGGKLEWGGNGEGEVSLQATWDQGGQGSHHAKEEGFQVSRRDSGKRGVDKGNQQGELTRDCAWLSIINLCICTIILCECS
jgi:hypothetical protein